MSIEIKKHGKIVNEVLDIFIERYLLQYYNHKGIDGYLFKIVKWKRNIEELNVFIMRNFIYIKAIGEIQYFWSDNKERILKFFKDYPSCVLGMITKEQVVSFFLQLMGKE